MELNHTLIQEIQSIIVNAQANAIRKVDNERVLMYWQIGKVIFEEEQQGKERASYGEYLIKSLANHLQPIFGSGFSGRQLERYRQFYRVFPIASALRTQFSWTHHKLLISIANVDKREFYIAETTKNNWTARQLERQINSQLFERLLLSNDRFEKQDFENPTIGILLCADKNDTVVKITLRTSSKNIIASKYQLYLPTEQQLIVELKKELNKLEK